MMATTHVSSASFSSAASHIRRKRVGTARAVASNDFKTEKKVKLGGSELRVFKIGIGAWSWGDTSYWNHFDWDELRKVGLLCYSETS